MTIGLGGISFWVKQPVVTVDGQVELLIDFVYPPPHPLE